MASLYTLTVLNLTTPQLGLFIFQNCISRLSIDCRRIRPSFLLKHGQFIRLSFLWRVLSIKGLQSLVIAKVFWKLFPPSVKNPIPTILYLFAAISITLFIARITSLNWLEFPLTWESQITRGWTSWQSRLQWKEGNPNLKYHSPTTSLLLLVI